MCGNLPDYVWMARVRYHFYLLSLKPYGGSKLLGPGQDHGAGEWWSSVLLVDDIKKGVYWVFWVWNHSEVFFWNNVTLDSWHHFYLMVTVPVHMMMNLGVPWHALMIIFRKRLMFFLGLIVSVNCIMFFWSHHLNGPGSSWTSLLLHRTLAFAICMEGPEN